MLTRTAIVLTCGALLVVGSACSSSGGKSAPQKQPTTTVKRHPTTTRPRSTTTRPGTPTTTGGFPTVPQPRIADLILTNGPPGFELQPDEVGDTGPTNLIKATNDDNSVDGRQALLSAGFDTGYQRLWTSVDDTGTTPNQDYLFLYRFATPEGAQAYMQHWRVSLLTTNTGKAVIQPFEPQLIPDAVGITANDPDQGSTSVVLFTKGPYAVKAFVVGGKGVDQSGAADDMAYAQYQQLP